MFLRENDLLKLPVKTKSGEFLGQISGIEIDSESHQIARYYVKSSGLMAGLFNNELIIDRVQVISIDRDKMVVEDNLSREKILVTKSSPAVE